MPPLQNLKHEQFAHAVLENPSVTQAYIETYNPPQYDSAKESASRLLSTNVNVRNRIQEILESKGLTVDYLMTYGRDKFLLNEDANVGLKAWRTFLELQGLLNTDQGISVAQIVFNEVMIQSPQNISET